jgi:hypothetical protein
MRWHQATPHVVLPDYRGPRARPVESRRCHTATCPGNHRAAGPHWSPETTAVHPGVHGAKTYGEALCTGSLGVVPVRQALLVLINSKTNLIAAIMCIIFQRLVAHLSATRRSSLSELCIVHILATLLSQQLHVATVLLVHFLATCRSSLSDLSLISQRLSHRSYTNDSFVSAFGCSDRVALSLVVCNS